MDVDEYLERIAYTGPLDPTRRDARGLHRAHMLAVPFENLDIHLGRRNVLDAERKSTTRSSAAAAAAGASS